MGVDFLKCYFLELGVWVSDFIWENYVVIFVGVGFEVSIYFWYDEVINGVCFNDLLVMLKILFVCSIVLLYLCCYNLMGVDFIND